MENVGSDKFNVVVAMSRASKRAFTHTRVTRVTRVTHVNLPAGVGQ